MTRFSGITRRDDSKRVRIQMDKPLNKVPDVLDRLGMVSLRGCDENQAVMTCKTGWTLYRLESAARKTAKGIREHLATHFSIDNFMLGELIESLADTAFSHGYAGDSADEMQAWIDLAKELRTNGEAKP